MGFLGPRVVRLRVKFTGTAQYLSRDNEDFSICCIPIWGSGIIDLRVFFCELCRGSFRLISMSDVDA